ncbi:hypothetical protein DPMN_188427 [Dreissena polymorpha]|uniref:Chromo domain-containing protein n=1 Tax=Dreissena polymorpha TaxID=45954 RepID=A0A9D4IBB7_DREPO|nr:hypothetical protein DPMN_188427 [Dreissena polymorpha]
MSLFELVGQDIVQLDLDQFDQVTNDEIIANESLDQSCSDETGLGSSLQFDKILMAAYHKGHIVYKVRYKDCMGKTMSQWKNAEEVPENNRKDFHIKYTFSGRVRKRPIIK